jgi:hypothetical protein
VSADELDLPETSNPGLVWALESTDDHAPVMHDPSSVGKLTLAEMDRKATVAPAKP